MRISMTCLSALALLSLCLGCNQGTPGGPGTTGTPNTATGSTAPVVGHAEDTFTLSVPVLATSVKPGATTEAKIGIKRGKNFDQDVALSFADVPADVRVVPEKAEIKHSEEETTIQFEAGPNAVAGDYKIKVTGHPTKGSDASVDFSLSVSARDTFTLSSPLLATSLKQGETKVVEIGIKRDKDFAHDVSLKIGKPPTGVTIEPADGVIKQADSNIQIKVTAAADAALGDFTVPITGHSESGDESTTELGIKIVKE